MELSEIIQGGGLVLSGGVVMKLLDWAKSAWTARNQRTEIAPDPLNVKNEKKPVYVTVGEFNTRLGKVEQDIKDLRGDIQSSNAAVLAKLDENDQRSEERARQTHQRLDPFIRELGAVHGKMDIIEKAALSATIGGKK
jgi:hypothetical protein